MPHLTRLLLVLLLAGLRPLPMQAGTETLSFEMDGLSREALLTIPDGLDGPAPLVLALHGLLEDATSMRQRVTRRRLDALAEAHGFVVVYPSAWGRVWNLSEGTGADRLLPRRDDIAFLERVIDEARARAEIDPTRIFAAGYSMGGMMATALACKRPGLIRALSVTGSALPAMFVDDCRDNPPDGVLMIHGTDDDVVPFDGGAVYSGPLARMQMIGHEQALAMFAAAKGCRGAPEQRRWDEKDDHMVVTRSAWYTCQPGAVEGYVVEGGGHRWPSGGPILPVTGSTTYEIEGSATVWGFFSRFK